MVPVSLAHALRENLLVGADYEMQASWYYGFS